MKPKKCKNCKWLNVKPTAKGRIVVHKDWIYKCNYPEPEQPILPDSIIKSWSFEWPPSRKSVAGDEGEDCATFEQRVK